MSRHKSQQRQRAEDRAGELAHRTVDDVDPPAWGPPPPDATGLIVRCHELRRKPLDQLTVEDLRLGIGQQIAVSYLIPLALATLRENPLAEGDYYPGDLLSAVLTVDDQFWHAHAPLAAEVLSILDNLDDAPEDLLPEIERFRTVVP